jgi:hypothetical protein|tara:strand:- start:2812 stop:3411 length:600 start_codon:yes stop_codon:yes gene_type:complete
MNSEEEQATLIVELEEWEWQHAISVASYRTTQNWHKEDAQQYQGNKSAMEDNRTANERTCICELAVAKGTNRYWSGSAWPASAHNRHRSQIADAGRNIEVRSVRTRGGLKIKETDTGKGTILFGARTLTTNGKEELRKVEILGLIDLDKAWEAVKDNDPPDYIKYEETIGRRTREIPISMLQKLRLDENGNYIDKRQLS